VPTDETRFTKADVEAVLQRIRPALALDGGDVRLISIVGNDVCLELLGSCRTCTSGPMTLRYGIEVEMALCLPGFGRILTPVPVQAETALPTVLPGRAEGAG
jgi:Fe-S cluster biogenesis protein NfuA